MHLLVGGFNHLEKNSQWEGLSHILWKPPTKSGILGSTLFFNAVYHQLSKFHVNPFWANYSTFIAVL